MSEQTPAAQRIEMVHELHTAIYGDSWARPDTPEKVWKMLLERVEDAVTERNALIAGLALVRSMPVVDAKDRLGYDCASCGSPLGEPHRKACAWDAAMRVLRSGIVTTNAPVAEAAS